MVSQSPPHVNIEYTPLLLSTSDIHKDIQMYIDLFYVNGFTLLHTRLGKINFWSVQAWVSISKGQIIKGLEIVKQIYDIRGLKIAAYHGDNKFYIKALYTALLIGGTAQYFSIFGKNSILKNLKIGPTLLDIWWLVKSPFDRVSDRNVRNGKMPVIGLASPLLDLQLVHAPPHSLAVSKRNAGECMFPGGSWACPCRKFAIAYVRPPLLLIY